MAISHQAQSFQSTKRIVINLIKKKEKNESMKKKKILRRYYKCGKAGHKHQKCKNMKKSDKSEKMDKAEKVLDEDKNDLVLCTVKSKPVQEKTKRFNLLLMSNPLLHMQFYYCKLKQHK